jgi:hypothetical protein
LKGCFAVRIFVQLFFGSEIGIKLTPCFWILNSSKFKIWKVDSWSVHHIFIHLGKNSNLLRTHVSHPETVAWVNNLKMNYIASHKIFLKNKSPKVYSHNKVLFNVSQLIEKQKSTHFCIYQLLPHSNKLVERLSHSQTIVSTENQWVNLKMKKKSLSAMVTKPRIKTLINS